MKLWMSARPLVMRARSPPRSMGAQDRSARVKNAISHRISIALPTDDVGIDSIAAGLAVGAHTDDCGIVPVVAGVLVNVVVAPGIFGHVLLDVGARPLVEVAGLFAQRSQALFISGKE